MSLKDARRTFKAYRNYPFLRFSDAHTLNDIGSGWTPLLMETVSFDELKMALKNEGGRRICYEG
jgi:PHP family Zn ribbon phosphoesterase